MPLPVSITQLLLFAVVLLPGLTFAGVKRYCIGIREMDYGATARVLDAIFISLLFLVAYAAIGIALVGGPLTQLPQALIDEVNGWPGILRATALVILTVLIPGLIAAFAYKGIAVGRTRPWIQKVERGHTSEPRAWEGAARGASSSMFVRVQMEDGRYYGGWYGGSSRMGVYPQGRDLFLERQWKMSPEGVFIEALPDGRGIWISVTDAVVVEWLMDDQQNEVEDE